MRVLRWTVRILAVWWALGLWMLVIGEGLFGGAITHITPALALMLLAMLGALVSSIAAIRREREGGAGLLASSLLLGAAVFVESSQNRLIATAIYGLPLLIAALAFLWLARKERRGAE